MKPPSPPSIIEVAPGLELKLLQRADQTDVLAVEAMVHRDDRPGVFYYMTDSPLRLGLDAFLDDPSRATYALWRNGEPIACTTLYNADWENRTTTMGYTWLAPKAQGAGMNTQMKKALFDALRNAGYEKVFMRADVENKRSIAAMEKVGAVFDHEEDEPRVYKYDDPRVSRSVYYRVDL